MDTYAIVYQAYWEAEQDAQEKARIKREERVIKQWTRLVQGLRIRQRLQDQYSSKPEGHIDVSSDVDEPNETKVRHVFGGVRCS